MISYKKQQEQQDKTKGLYNGNIAWMMTQIPELERQIGTNHDLVASVYQYDQLQRIIQSRTYHNPNGNWAYDGNFNTDYSFDANGNLKTLKRRAKGTQIDNFTYNYNYQGVDLINNQLTHIDDATFVSLSGINDLGDQAPNNYLYNAEGSLIKDAQEGINNITWTFQDKIQQIDKGNGVTFDYTYDPAGNRLSKDIDGDQTIYVRDASGELLAVYENTSGQWIQTEITLYGAKRLGTLHRNVVASNVTDTENSYIYDRGFKQYELANHLGNVLVSVSDKKRGIDQNLGGGTDGIVDKYLANVSQASNYYPFGWHMPDHNYSSTENRFGFQAQEEDPELWEGATNYKYRMHNPRTGRFFSVDPLDGSYPELTPFQFSSNSPIYMIELEGLEGINANDLADADPLDWEGLTVVLDEINVSAKKMTPLELEAKREVDSYYGAVNGLIKMREKDPFYVPMAPRSSARVQAYAMKGDYLTEEEIKKTDGILGQAVIEFLPIGKVGKLFKLFRSSKSKRIKGLVGDIGNNDAIPLAPGIFGGDGTLKRASALVKPKPGFFDIAIHGNLNSKKFSVFRGFIHRGGKLNPKNWVDIDHRTLSLYTKKLGHDGKQPIRLMSCNSAKFGAQNVSNKLGVPVMAPDGFLFIHRPSGIMTIGPTTNIMTGGSWKYFTPGK